jgi:hypothetical protein
VLASRAEDLDAPFGVELAALRSCAKLPDWLLPTGL